MNAITINDVINATGGTLLCGNPDEVISAVCTDSRNITPGSLFVPIAGENFDAHNFIPAVLTGGCVAALTAKKVEPCDKTLIAVKDTRKALADLAAFYRQTFSIPFIAVTGSVGKTTVKELTAAVLSAKFNVLKTAGNFNNDIGLPLTLFRLENTHEAAITEMGMSGFGEIDLLAGIAKPDIGIVTNIGLSHIEKLGSQENIYKAKAELFSHVNPEGTVILNGDDPILAAHRSEISQKTITVGLTPGCNLTAQNIKVTSDGVSFTICSGKEQAEVTLQIPGEHNVINALLACAAGLCLGVSLDVAAAALANYVATDKRLQLIEMKGLTIINDCYNAAPASVEAALKVLCAHKGRKIAVLGDMKELGAYTETAHRTMGQQVADLGVDALFALGESAALAAQVAKEKGMEHVVACTQLETLTLSLWTFLQPGDTVLIKGSRAMGLERVIELLNKMP